MKLLYNQTTGTLAPYPRDDDGPVIGLDPRYVEMDLIQEPQPEYDPATQRLDPTEVIDLDALTVTRGWDLIELPPPAPTPDWATFRGSLLISPGVAATMAAARTAGCEPGVTALPVALEKAQQGDPGDFAACWALVVRDGQAPAELIGELVATAEACHLPAEFIAALQPVAPAPEMVRARNPDGTFISDDPATPGVDEAWVPA